MANRMLRGDNLSDGERCERIKADGSRCKNRRMLQTNVCRAHGASTMLARLERVTRTGMTVKALARSPRLQELMEQYSALPDLTDLIPDLALCRAVLHRYLEALDPSTDSDPVTASQTLEIIDRVGRQVKRLVDIQTAAEYRTSVHHVEAYMAQLACLFAQVLEDCPDQSWALCARDRIHAGVAMIKSGAWKGVA